jgi:hypothetical protein
MAGGRSRRPARYVAGGGIAGGRGGDDGAGTRAGRRRRSVLIRGALSRRRPGGTSDGTASPTVPAGLRPLQLSGGDGGRPARGGARPGGGRDPAVDGPGRGRVQARSAQRRLPAARHQPAGVDVAFHRRPRRGGLPVSRVAAVPGPAGRAAARVTGSAVGAPRHRHPQRVGRMASRRADPAGLGAVAATPPPGRRCRRRRSSAVDRRSGAGGVADAASRRCRLRLRTRAPPARFARSPRR